MNLASLGKKLTASGVRAVLEPHGAIRQFELCPSHVFVLYESAAASRRCFAALHRTVVPSLARTLYIDFLRDDFVAWRATLQPLVDQSSHLSFGGPQDAMSDHAAVMAQVPGLTLISDFVTVEEEQRLLAAVDANESGWIPLKLRRVAHYGYGAGL